MSWLWTNFQAAGWFSIVLTLLYYLIRPDRFYCNGIGAAAPGHQTQDAVSVDGLGAADPILSDRTADRANTAADNSPAHSLDWLPCCPFTASFMILLSGSLAGNIAFVLTILLATLCYCSLFRQYREPLALIYGLMAGFPFLEMIGCFLIWHLSSLPLPDPRQDGTVFVVRRR